MKRVGDIGELELIRRLTRAMPRRADVPVGIGDDCAVVRRPGGREDLVLTTDAVIERIHFRPGERPMRIGHKAVGRVLSDIASMGAAPLYLLIDLVVPPSCPVKTIQTIYRGATRLAHRYNAAIIGGDTARGRTLELHVFGVGCAARGRAITRAGARPGDILFLTGRLGGSRAGQHLDFKPRVEEGSFLAARGARAMIDITDGLATDLRHVLRASCLGAMIDANAVPIAREAAGWRAAWTDGEDFELLAAVPVGRAAELERDWRRRFRRPLFRIGVCESGRSGRIRVRAADGSVRALALHGFEHFQS